MNLYEAMYILDTNLSDDRIKEATAALKSEITERKGEILKVDEIGRRSLAYPIRKLADGYYLVLYFRLPASEIAPLRDRYRLNPDVVRYLIVKRRESEPLVAPRGRRRHEDRSHAAPAPQEPSGEAASAEAKEEEAVGAVAAPDTGTPESQPKE